MPTMSDRELLQDYVAHRREDAFRDLVNRHLALVHSSARRQTANDALAEEVTQAVFILLARKAGQLTGRDALAGWLLKTTRFVALKAVRGEVRRRQREKEVITMNPETSPDETWRQMSPVLDEAIAALGETDRNAVVLRFHQGKSLREIGEVIGINEEAAKKRVARALDKLRSFFARRGCALGTGVIATTLAAHAIEAAPAGLSAKAATVALTQSAVGTAVLPALVRETLSAWWWTKVKWTSVAGSAAVLGLALMQAVAQYREPAAPLAALAAGQHSGGDGSSVAANVAGGSSDGASSTSAAATAGVQHVRLIVLDDATGNRLADAAVHVRYWHGWSLDYRDDLRTDEAGVCLVPLPAHSFGRLDIGAVRLGHVPRVFTWRETTGDAFPREHTLRLEPATAIGGQIVDLFGVPVVMAEIRLQFSGGGDSDTREPHRGFHGFVNHELTVAQTDAEGRWSVALISEKHDNFVLKAQHPLYRQLSLSGIVGEHAMDWAALKAGTAVHTLLPALTLSGIVRDTERNPLAGVKVARGASADRGEDFIITGTDGLFTLRPLELGPLEVLVKSEGFAPQAHTIEIQDSTPFREFVLSPGKHLRVRVVNAAREPIPQARVVLEQWGSRRHMLDWTVHTEDDGRIEWTSAPEGVLHLTAVAQGHAFTREVELRADGREHELVLLSEARITGTVLDEHTGRPLESFKVFPGSGFSAIATVNWDRSSVQPGTNGGFELTYNETRFPLHIRAEAEGYHPAEAIALNEHNPAAHVELRLRRVDPSEAFSGVVVLPDGSPAVGAQVGILSGINRRLYLSGKKLRAAGAQLIRADQRGRFSFGPDADAYLIVATHEAGFAQLGLIDIQPNQMVIPLQPWAQLKGRFVRRHGPVADQTIGILNGIHSGLGFDRNYWLAKTGADGDFEFPLVPPAPILVVLDERGPTGTPFGYQTKVDVKPGRMNELTFGETGITVTGRLQLAGKLSGLDWQRGSRGTRLLMIGQLFASPRITTSAPAGFLQPENHNLLAAWHTTEAGKASWLELGKRPTLRVNADGSFQISAVPPGEYELELLLNQKHLDEHLQEEKFQMHLRRTVTIPDMFTGEGNASIDLGVIEFPALE
jgi:RNA polymerase sigma factor (sigma-70 family)